MSALVYILRKSLKNTLRDLIRKPMALIAYIGAIIAAITIPAIISFVATDSYALAILVSGFINMVLIALFMWIGTGLFKAPELP